MFWERYYSGVGFSLLLQSVTRGPLRCMAFTFDKDPSTFISWNPFTRNIKFSGTLKKNWSENSNENATGSWKQSVFVNLQKSLFFEKRHFSADVWEA